MISKQRLINELKFLIFYIPFCFFITYFMFGVAGKANWVPLFIVLCSFYLFKIIWTIYLPMNTWKNRGEFEQSNIILSYMAAPCSVLGGIAMIFVANSIPFGVSLALMGVYASIAMNLRRKGLEDFFESSSDPSFLVWYWALGMLLCFPIIYPGFTYFTGTTESWIFLILTLILGILVSTVMLSPDKVDRVAPVDMTTGNGVFIMLAIGIGVIYASFCVMGLFNPDFRMW